MCHMATHLQLQGLRLRARHLQQSRHSLARAGRCRRQRQGAVEQGGPIIAGAAPLGHADQGRASTALRKGAAWLLLLSQRCLGELWRCFRSLIFR